MYIKNFKRGIFIFNNEIHSAWFCLNLLHPWILQMNHSKQDNASDAEDFLNTPFQQESCSWLTFATRIVEMYSGPSKPVSTAKLKIKQE